MGLETTWICGGRLGSFYVRVTRTRKQPDIPGEEVIPTPTHNSKVNLNVNVNPNLNLNTNLNPNLNPNLIPNPT